MRTPSAARSTNAAMNYTPVQVKVREATNKSESWAASGTLMNEIAKATFSYEEFPEVRARSQRRRPRAADVGGTAGASA